MVLGIYQPNDKHWENIIYISLGFILIALTEISDDDEYITQAMQFGAKGYLLKDTAIEEIADAIRTATKGYTQL